MVYKETSYIEDDASGGVGRWAIGNECGQDRIRRTLL
jgi:hypothetical protein